MGFAGAWLILAALIPFAAFTWGVKGHFRSTGRMPPGMRLVSLLSLAGFLWMSWRLLAGPVGAGWAAALALFGLALALFIWAVRTTRARRPTLAFSTDQPVFLVREGPFRLVRHPFYLSYLTFWIGTAAATPAPAGWMAPLVMLLVYGDAARREEAKFAGSPFAAEYALYRTRAGMFLPPPSALRPR